MRNYPSFGRLLLHAVRLDSDDSGHFSGRASVLDRDGRPLVITGIFLVIAGGINHFIAWDQYCKLRHTNFMDHSREDS